MSLEPFSRALKLAAFLNEGGLLTTRYIMETFGVSRATAKRDMAMIESSYPVTVEQKSNCDHGGPPHVIRLAQRTRR